MDPLERLDAGQRRTLEGYASLLVDFNQNINLISRGDEAHVVERHILHSLFLSLRGFPAGSTVVDWGTGGGLPALPIAVAFPDVHVVAVDAVEKKARAVRAIARRLGITNLDVRAGRAETVRLRAAYSVSRAAAPLAVLWSWHRRVMEGEPDEAGCWQPGLVCLKGGDLDEEVADLGAGVEVERIALSDLTERPYFADKALLACRRRPAAGAEPTGRGHR